MEYLAIILLALMPVAILLVLYSHWVDKKRWFVSKIRYYYLAGVLSCLPSYLTESTLISQFLFDRGLWTDFLEAFVYVSFVEELYKWIMFIIAYKWFYKVLKPLDYITAGVLVGLGFATLENLLYGMLYDWQTLIVRLFTAVPAHLAYGVLMGFFFYRFAHTKKIKYLLASLFAPVMMHGLYDIFIVQDISDKLLAGALVVLLINYIWDGVLIYRLKQNQEHPKEAKRTDVPVFTAGVERDQTAEDRLDAIILQEE